MNGFINTYSRKIFVYSSNFFSIVFRQIFINLFDNIVVLKFAIGEQPE